MDNQTYQDLILAMTGASLEITRQILNIAQQNLQINTATLEVSKERNMREKQLIDAMNNLMERIDNECV